MSTILQAFLELAGLAVLVPVLLLVLNDQGIQQNKYLGFLYDLIGVDYYGVFLIIVLFSVFTFIVLKNFVLHKINNYRNKILVEVYSHYTSGLYRNYISKGLTYVKNTGHTTLSHNVIVVSYQFVFGYLSAAVSLVAELLLCLLVFVSLCFINIYIAVLEIVLFAPIVLFYHLKIAGRMQEAGKSDNLAKRNLWRITSETFRGFADVVVNRFLPFLEDSFRTGVAGVSQSKIRVERLISLSSKSIEVAITVLIIGFVAGFYFIGRGERQFLPLIGIFAAASLKLLPSVRAIISLVGTMRNNRHTVDVLNEPGPEHKHGHVPEQKHGYGQEQKHEPGQGAEAYRKTLTFSQSIEFRGVTFGFEPDRPVLREVSFTILKGERVGISGPTGKGKSTLMYLLMGLYRPQKGSILIDGVPLGTENLEAWHDMLGYVSQDVFITEGSLAQNISPFGDDPGERLEASLRMAALSDWKETLPLGADTLIGEGGARLSGGERQRVGIARAHFKKAAVLLMDEPTSALDPATETEITQTLLQELMDREKTVVIISHRESLLMQCDRIIDISGWTL
ncbi:MAG TPA: ABC transporter ATP-binding protein [Prolixibacteraceae bacterium]|nr:ABC transporter ATP-binding protein [Prolixibacteraceae bacterium]HPB78227.1 ABC transporter ATP-binding protein [Bacteroidales bacterium]HQB59073.1 ABC transporter ATP-binding protein [Bacteroidales bacterium]HQP64710.1 ABC transporter ATP-binding protein [Bacteroidales bacterium]